VLSAFSGSPVRTLSMRAYSVARSMSSSDSRSLAQIVFSTQLLALLHRKLGVADWANGEVVRQTTAMTIAAWGRGEIWNRMVRSCKGGRRFQLHRHRESVP